MTKEELLSAIKAKLGSTQFSERTLSDYVSGMCPFVPSDESQVDGFVDAQVSILRSMNGNYHKDFSEELSRLSRKEDKTSDEQPPSKEGGAHIDPSVMEELRALRESFKGLSAEFTDLRSAAHDRDVRGKVRKNLTERIRRQTGRQPVEYVFDTTLRDMVVKDDSDVRALTDEYEALYNENLRKTFGETDFPSFGSAAGNGKADSAFLDDLFARKAEQTNGSRSED